MNYYERHIGDYLKDTAHLSLLEHGVYSRLLDAYYSRELPIPQDQSYRLVGAKARDERAAVDAVLNEFFQLVEGVWFQKRCDEVITAHAVFIQSQKDKAAKRWHPSGNAQGMPEHMPRHESGIDPAIPPTPHSPLPIRSKSELRSPDAIRGSRIPEDFALTDERRNVATAEGLDPTRTLASFRDFWISKPGAGGRKLDWDATWRNWCRSDKTARKPKEGGNGLQRFNAG